MKEKKIRNNKDDVKKELVGDFCKLYKIDISQNEYKKESFDKTNNINNYIIEIIDKILDKEGDREYEFEETLMTTKNCLEKLIKQSDEKYIEQECNNLAAKLLKVENDTQIKIQQLGSEIQKGVLLIARKYLNNNKIKIIIAKADYLDFLKETSGEKTSGLPIKKRIFKSFILDCTFENNLIFYNRMTTFDSNTTLANYWWKNFLELRELRSDEDNTKIAFDSINNKILEQVKKNSKPDYLILWNTTLKYFKSAGEFDINYYAETVIGSYVPSGNIKIETLKNKILELPKTSHFDNKFQKIPTKIRKRIKTEVKLTNEIDLIIKDDIPNLDQTIKPHEENGKKYLMIQTEEGYQYAERLKNEK